LIFLRSTLREFAAAGIAVFAVLLAITFTSQLIRLLSYAAQGRIPADSVITLLGLVGIGSLSLLLSATLFLSVLLTLTRLYRDSEMVVWQSSGLGLLSWVKPVALYAAPIVTLVAVLTAYLTPWAAGKAEQYRHQLETRDDVSAVTPGVFRESKNSDRVFFVDKVSSDLTQVSNVFAHVVQNQRTSVIVASRGYVETAGNGDRYLVMLSGRRYQGTPGQADYQVDEFGRYALRIEQNASKAFFPSQKSLATGQLLAQPTAFNLAELAFRIGLPVSTVILAFLAIPMSAVNPRTGRLVNVAMAVLLFMTYSNLVSISQTWIARGRMNPFLGMWLVHAVMLTLLVVLFAWRLGRLRGLLPSRR
jgi:lipopolysaccharide export system permease protein